MFLFRFGRTNATMTSQAEPPYKTLIELDITDTVGGNYAFIGWQKHGCSNMRTPSFLSNVIINIRSNGRCLNLITYMYMESSWGSKVPGWGRIAN